MSTLDDLRAAIETFLSEYPRDLPLELSKLVRIDSKASEYPNGDRQGVYFLFDESLNLLYVGKASCGNRIKDRLTARFTASGRPRRGKEKFRAVCFVATIPMPRKRAFEAPSIEEYFISRLRPGLNDQCWNSNDMFQIEIEKAIAELEL